MSSGLRSVFLILMYLFSSTGPGAFISYPGIEATLMIENDMKIAEETAEQNRLAEEERIRQELEAEHTKLYTPLDFERADVTDYAVLYLPESHFKTTNSDRGSSLIYSYLDDSSTLKVSYKSKISEDTNINELIGMDSSIEGQRVDTSKLDMYRYEAEVKENELRHTCWVVKQADSILVADAVIYPETDYEAFKLALEVGLDKSNIYYVSDYIFSVPETGYYSQFIKYEVQGDNSVNNSEENVDNKNSTSNESYYGILDTDEISSDWKDMKIKLDGDIIELPCNLDVLINLGYSTVDKIDELTNNTVTKEITDEDGNVVEEQTEYVFATNYKKQIYITKPNGVCMKIEVTNESDTDIELKDLTIKQIKISRADFGKYISQSKYNELYLPELIYVGGATWDISADNFLKLLNTRNVYKIEQAKGGYKIGTLSTDKEIEVITDGYSNITDIRMTIK